MRHFCKQVWLINENHYSYFCGTIVTVTPLPGCSRFPLSSTARLKIVAVPVSARNPFKNSKSPVHPPDAKYHRCLPILRPGNSAAPSVHGVTSDNQSLAWQNRAIRGCMDCRIRGLEIGGGARRGKIFLKRCRLYPHVRKQIDGGLLDVTVRSMRIDANAGGVFIGALRGTPVSLS